MPWDRKRFLGYVEIIQLILGMTDNIIYFPVVQIIDGPNETSIT